MGENNRITILQAFIVRELHETEATGATVLGGSFDVLGAVLTHGLAMFRKIILSKLG